jgi:hypothetical protein
MTSALRIVLMACYPLLIGIRALGALTGRDPLGLARKPVTYWTARPRPASPRSYFSPGEPGSAGASAIVFVAGVVAWLQQSSAASPAPAPPPAEIADEIYTLW